MASKILQPIKKETSAPVQEKFLQVQDVAHEEPQSESFVQEEKTLSEKEAEFKQKMGREESGKSDLDEERELKRVEVEQSLDVFEKERAKVQQKRVKSNIQKVEQVSRQQLQKVRDVQKTVKSNKQVRAAVAQQKAVMYQNDTLSNLISMTINDAIMNAGKEAGYDEDHLDEKMGLTGHATGRQKTILVNGATVTLDEDVANAITAKRSPLLEKKQQVVADLAGDVRAEKGDFLQVADVEEPVVVSFVEQSYLDSQFCKLEQSLQSDRMEMQRAFVAYRPPYYETKYDYGYQLDDSEKKLRELPSVSWGDVGNDYLPNGRKLPYIDYSEDYQMQFE